MGKDVRDGPLPTIFTSERPRGRIDRVNYDEWHFFSCVRRHRVVKNGPVSVLERLFVSTIDE